MGIRRHSPEVNRLIEKQMTDDYGAIVCTLVGIFGARSLEHVQRVCRDSFERAKTDWGKNGIPRDPRTAVWNEITEDSSRLFCAKVNYLSDRSRRGERFDVSKFRPPFPEKEEVAQSQAGFLLAICSPAIKDSTRKPLALEMLCGFSRASLARMFGKSEKALERELSREKEKIASGAVVPAAMTAPENVERNLDAAARNIYEMFAMGLDGTGKGSSPVALLCSAAIRLGETLCGFSLTERAATHALVSFMLLNAARLDTMRDSRGRPVGIREQNRDLWDRDMIRRGLEHLSISAENGNEVTEIHLRAGVEAVHSLAGRYGDTDWDRIISLYDSYLACRHCPAVELRKAIAISRKRGPREAIEAIGKIRGIEKLESHDLLYSTLGNLHFDLHSYRDAISNFRRATELAREPFEKAFYSKKIRICEDRMNMSRRYAHALSF